MSPCTLDDRLSGYTADIHDKARTNQGGVTVWWDVRKGRLDIFPSTTLVSKCLVGLATRFNQHALVMYVGQFDMSATPRDIRKALEGHSAGRLVP